MELRHLRYVIVRHPDVDTGLADLTGMDQSDALSPALKNHIRLIP